MMRGIIPQDPSKQAVTKAKQVAARVWYTLCILFDLPLIWRGAGLEFANVVRARESLLA